MKIPPEAATAWGDAFERGTHAEIGRLREQAKRWRKPNPGLEKMQRARLEDQIVEQRKNDVSRADAIDAEADALEASLQSSEPTS